MSVVRGVLKIPRQLAGIGVNGDNRRRVQVVALSPLSDENRVSIAGCDVNQVEFGIVGRRDPNTPARGSVSSTFGTPFSRAQVRVVPSSNRSVTSKSV